MRLIDADEAIINFGFEWDDICPTRDEVVSFLRKQKTIAAAPVARGEWMVTDAYPHRVYCSLCYKTNVPNEEWLYEKNDYPKYCMWCGAKMEDKPCG